MRRDYHTIPCAMTPEQQSRLAEWKAAKPIRTRFAAGLMLLALPFLVVAGFGGKHALLFAAIGYPLAIAGYWWPRPR
jgi:hypothetical protein